MTTRQNGAVLQQLHVLFNLGTFGKLTDRQLLGRFSADRGEAAELAFAALVERHGPTVLRICRAVLRDEHEAQDAFQATFLVLARKGRRLWVRDSLGPWLHQVAYRVASCARSALARRRRHERLYAERAASRPAAERDGRDGGIQSVILEEIDRLPEAYGAVLRLCDLAGCSHEEAARHLGWPVGTVKSRSARGRERLRARLVRRGLAPATGLPWVGPAAGSAPIAVPAGLLEVTVRSARQIVAGGAGAGVVPATVASLMKGASMAMFMSKLKGSLVSVLAASLVGAGAVVVAQQAGRSPEAEIGTARADAVGSLAATSSTLDGAAGDGDPVGRELRRLDLEILAEEVQQLRDQVEAALRHKLRTERRDSGAASRDPGIKPEEVRDAKSAYEAARDVYLARARELRREQRRLTGPEVRREVNLEGSGEPMPPGNDRAGGGEAGRSMSPPSAVAIGSIDMDAVFERYEKVKQASKRLEADAASERERQAMLQTQLKELTAQLKEHVAGGSDSTALEGKIADLRGRIEAGRREAQDDFARRESRTLAALYEEIRGATGSVAKAKGLIYVVKGSPRPLSVSVPSEVMSALGRPVIYADPRFDITEEVIRDLNRRFRDSSDATSDVKQSVR